MKRIISIILAALIVFSILPTAYAADFKDLSSSHWAYSYVTKLVADGTINGYNDGSFRPEGTVTRAEFVKMIGVGSEVLTKPYYDVPSSHWAYKYVMASGLDPVSAGTFMPDTPITRGDVAKLLWKRAGSPSDVVVPPVVHRQGESREAISWVYTNGIMVGDDLVNLRLDDTLTRAEASALIVRSGNVSGSDKTIFADAIDQGIYEEVYKAFRLTDRPYKADDTITNGELALAAARLLSGDDFPTYPNVSAYGTFEHKYAQPLNMLCRYYLGSENDNAAYADRKATVQETIAALMFVTQKSAGVYIPSGKDATYQGVSSGITKEYASLLKCAFNNGIFLASPEKMKLDKEITMKEFATLVLLFDGFSGFHRISVVTPTKTYLKNERIRINYDKYPENASDYRIVLDSLPNKIFEKSFAKAESKPVEVYNATAGYRAIFLTMFDTWVRALSTAGYELEVKYYPSLAVNNGNGYTMRCEVKFVKVPENTKLGDLVNCVNSKDGDRKLKSGDVICADFDTGAKITGLTIGIENMVLSKPIY